MSDRPLALITGASAGLGEVFAERLAPVHDLLLVARRQERLAALADRLGGSEVLAADLSQPSDLSRLEKRIAETPGLALLVNNAGFPGYRPFVEVDAATLEGLIDLHIRAVTRLTRAALPGMVKAGRGAVINVSSLLAHSGTLPPNPLPHRAIYAGAKAYLVAFTQALAGELLGSGVKVQALTPGVVDTEFHQRMPPEARARLKSMAMAPGDVVTASLAALAAGEVVCAPGLEDPSLQEKLGETQRALLSAANRPALAGRYKKT